MLIILYKESDFFSEVNFAIIKLKPCLNTGVRCWKV